MSSIVKCILWCIFGIFLLFRERNETGHANPLLLLGLLILGIPLAIVVLCAAWCFLAWVFCTVKVAFEVNFGYGIGMLIGVIGAILMGIGISISASK